MGTGLITPLRARQRRRFESSAWSCVTNRSRTGSCRELNKEKTVSRFAALMTEVARTEPSATVHNFLASYHKTCQEAIDEDARDLAELNNLRASVQAKNPDVAALARRAADAEQTAHQCRELVQKVASGGASVDVLQAHAKMILDGRGIPETPGGGSVHPGVGAENVPPPSAPETVTPETTADEDESQPVTETQDPPAGLDVSVATEDPVQPGE